MALTAEQEMTIILVRMPERTRFEIVYSVAVLGHLEGVPRRHHSLLRRELEQQLHFEPMVPTRNRKPLRGPNALGAEWELRCGPEGRYRVFYEVRADERRVWVLALGVKDRNRLLIGNQEIQL